MDSAFCESESVSARLIDREVEAVAHESGEPLQRCRDAVGPERKRDGPEAAVRARDGELLVVRRRVPDRHGGAGQGRAGRVGDGALDHTRRRLRLGEDDARRERHDHGQTSENLTNTQHSSLLEKKIQKERRRFASRNERTLF